VPHPAKAFEQPRGQDPDALVDQVDPDTAYPVEPTATSGIAMKFTVPSSNPASPASILCHLPATLTP